ncbi:MAG TPA: lipoyl(octanoyl) transferase LipB [Chitinophagales bacterium]|nr:lipoyl(octanoyl) transferase LipB [Chitinophagales bacterium]HMU99280.1 lipoyl(octanoyl) transferase LipB [Chitinophagales bacterium]HMV03802.1 lipoyl(octanoyl) transferase LipB [Chitinophagales bacterium]HMW95418.1 lipoyl(octanoyl) transferase LipB [Chitinophagales bacterium]HMY43628.1 lipoyl(octanoyl) transferase LipB [Chitinophagales bacterium]
MQQIQLHDVGRIRYADALTLQEEFFNHLVEQKLAGISNENQHHLILCEHFPVITVGKAGKDSNILLPETLLHEKGVDVFHINRGGDVTFHGFGQITGYPILDLDFFTSDLKHYMWLLEEVMIQTISSYNIEGYRIDGATGVWVNSKIDKQPKKIAAFGVKTSRWVTMHGFSLNVDVDLNYFNLINPCGFTDKGVTSIKEETNADINIEEIKQLILKNFSKIFNISFYL